MAPPSEIRIGVVGLGHMGDAFAENLLADGYSVTVFDRDTARAQALAGKGAQAAQGLADMAGCDLVLTSLPDDTALRSVTLDDGGLTSVMAKDAIHVSLGTISPGLSRTLAEAHHASGQRYVAGPVLGNPDLAHRRELFVLAAGADDDVARARPVLERLGQKLFVVGKDPALANVIWPTS